MVDPTRHKAVPMSQSSDSLVVSTYNCRGLPRTRKLLCSTRPDICSLLQQSDIVCLQETWYAKQNLAGINNLYEGFHGIGVAPTDYADGIVQGHPKGGVVILYRTSLEQHISLVDLNLDWCIAIEICFGNKKAVVACVYLPYQCHINEEAYTEKLGQLTAIVHSFQTTSFVIVGDWNANLLSPDNSLFAGHMLTFCEDLNLCISSCSMLPSSSYSFISSAWNSTSWLDHIVSSADFHSIISSMDIHYDMTDDDHIPISMTVQVDSIPSISVTDALPSCAIRWDSLPDSACLKYGSITDVLLTEVAESDFLQCNDPCCNDLDHQKEISKFYEDIVSCLRKAGNSVVNDCSGHASQYKFKCKPGWNDHVADLYAQSRSIFKRWIADGKPKHGPLFEEHRKARAKCKYAIRFIKSNENALRKESLACKFAETDPKQFWKEIKKISENKTPRPTSIENVVGEEDICELWRKHYYEIFNSLQSSSLEGVYFDDAGTPFEDMQVTLEEVESAINDLQCNKSCGLDGISAEHLKYASARLLPMLSKCLTSCFSHSFLPKSMLTVMLVPIVKNKAGKITCKDNYRPIALASVLSKVAEKIIQERMEPYLIVSCNQFGFKPKHGTDQCIFALKELVDSYRKLNSSTYICFLDASKAFDRINHKLLFQKLQSRGTPVYLLNILMYWYLNQTMCVKWGSATSFSFTVTNGVRQGGILSPHLFNVYMDELSISLNRCQVGLYAGDKLVNHIMYADDVALMSPSAAGLAKLIKKCELFGEQYDVNYNPKKSNIMVVRSPGMKSVGIPTFRLNGILLEEVNKVKYLGHMINNTLSDDDDINHQRRQLYARGNMLLRNFGVCSAEVKLKLFNTFCSNVYCCQLWWSYTKSTLNKLCISYHNILKLFLGISKFESTSLVCAVFNVPSFWAVLRKMCFKFNQRLCALLDNQIIASFEHSDLKYKSRIRIHWVRLLYVRQWTPG